jgi:hypothetical protein
VELLELLISKYGVGATLLGTITYIIYLTYQKMKPGTNTDKMLNSLMKRVDHLEERNRELDTTSGLISEKFPLCPIFK